MANSKCRVFRFALSGASGFDQTSGSACEGNEGESGFDFYDLDVVSVEYNEGVVNTVIANTGNESTPIGGYTWILVDGSSVLVDTPPSWTFGSSNEFSYDISDIVSQLDPGNHSLTVWVNGGEQEPLVLNTDGLNKIWIYISMFLKHFTATTL